MRDPRPLSARVHDWLRKSILEVELVPGAPIAESEVAARFSTSRTPVREALLKLATEDLVDIQPQRGTFVARMSLARIEEGLFIRQAIERAVLLRVIERRDRAPTVELLAGIIREQAAALVEGRVAAALAADERFHRTLVEASGVPGVWGVVMKARDLHHRVRAIAVPELHSGRQALADHVAILRALEAGDPAAGEHAMQEHLARNLVLAREIASRHPDYFEPSAARTRSET